MSQTEPPLRFEHILFPVDFSERSRSVVPFVKAVASHFGSRVTLLNVIKPPEHWPGADNTLFDIPAMERAKRHELTLLFNSSQPKTESEVTRVAEQGDPASVISDYAERHEVDLIMMPTRGFGTFRSLLLGSVTAKVLHDANCPVWTAAHFESSEITTRSEYQTLLCGIDATSKSITLIRFARRLAQEYNADLLLVHAILTPEYGEAQAFDGGWRQFLLDVAREEIAKLQNEAKTSLAVHLDFGPVSKVMRAAAVHHGADLVVIGRGCIHETLGRLRTNTYSVLSHSPCPVLSV